MAETISKRQATGRNYAYNNLNGFRCKGCKGRAVVDAGRVRIAHRQDCAIYMRLVLTHPRFFATLDMYRSTTSS